jgi:L-lactate utilization protein LutC
MLAVVDTNVVLVANNAHEGVSPECVISCTQKLVELMSTGNKVVIDDKWRILKEYQHKTTPVKNRRPGDVFVRWLLKNHANAKHVEKVSLIEVSENTFKNFPDSELQTEIDPPDRKFFATAAAHPEQPPVWQAADSEWIDWSSRLAAAGVTIVFICKADIDRIYRKKYPKKAPPTLP